MINPNLPRSGQLKPPRFGCWLTGLAVLMFLASIGLGWLVKSFLVLVGLILISPLLILAGLRLWLALNIVQAPCPVCGAQATSLKRSQFACPNCGVALRVEGKHFVRPTAMGTVDVDAREVSAHSWDK